MKKSENIPEDRNSTNILPEAGVLLPSLLSSKKSLSPMENTCWTVGRSNTGLVGGERSVLGLLIRERELVLKFSWRKESARIDFPTEKSHNRKMC